MAEPASDSVVARPPWPWSGSVTRECSTPSGRLKMTVTGTAEALAGRVARQRGQVHLLARAIDAAVGVGEGVDGARRVAALDAAVGQIEGGGGQVEEGVVAVGRFGDQHGRRQPPSPRLRPASKRRIAAAVGLGGAEHLVVAGDQAHAGIDDRRGAGERAHEGVQAVIAVDGGEAEVGDDEPLRGGWR